MRVDGGVNQRKYEVEVRRLREQDSVLRTWGCFVVRAEFPEIDVVFIPRHPLLLIGHRPAASSRLFLPGGAQQMVEAPEDWPACSARAFGVRLSLDDYDQRPISVTLADPFDWTPLPFAACPIGQYFPEDGGDPTNVVLVGYTGLDRPFLCLRGVREYHDHLQHADDEWAAIRAHFGAFRVLQLVWQTCVRNVRPALVLGRPAQAQWRSVREA